ncbi:DoxX family protein [Streptomyces sp. NBC_01591]|uniref:DoxX family protein n=1 Tax=Streptomyces sp. NBC_01591 TaxID=2975888 RepID=UPI002DDB726E|nr:DoxX family protein [Streptomyces sp. NBC_01591]WSD67824.1 DoxX family protein [Streptomyces sp. NBC_01591]
MSESTLARNTPAAARSGTRSEGPGRGALALTVARVVLALFLGFSAFAKLIAHESAVESFDRMGWNRFAMYTIGGLEMAGAIALLIPVLAGVAAIALCGLMAGASIVQLTLLDRANAIMPALLIVLFVLIARERRDRTATLVALVRRRA